MYITYIHKDTYIYTIVSGGTGYTAASTTLTIDGGGGTGATATPVITNGIITGVNVTNVGNNYSTPPTILIGTSIQSITIANAGTNYTTAATIEITGGGGTGATADLVFFQGIGTIITGVNITNAGSGYTSIPTVTINPNGPGSGAVVGTITLTGTGANIQCVLNASVHTLTLVDDGSGYNQIPRIRLCHFLSFFFCACLYIVDIVEIGSAFS